MADTDNDIVVQNNTQTTQCTDVHFSGLTTSQRSANVKPSGSRSIAKSSSSENTGSRSVHFLPSAKYAYNTQRALVLQVTPCSRLSTLGTNRLQAIAISNRKGRQLRRIYKR